MHFWSSGIRFPVSDVVLVGPTTHLRLRAIGGGKYEASGEIFDSNGKPLLAQPLIFDHSSPANVLSEGAYLQLIPLPAGVKLSEPNPPTSEGDFNFFVRACGVDGQPEFELSNGQIWSATGLKVEMFGPNNPAPAKWVRR
jgi:hypothetical protein